MMSGIPVLTSTALSTSQGGEDVNTRLYIADRAATMGAATSEVARARCAPECGAPAWEFKCLNITQRSYDLVIRRFYPAKFPRFSTPPHRRPLMSLLALGLNPAELAPSVSASGSPLPPECLLPALHDLRAAAAPAGGDPVDLRRTELYCHLRDNDGQQMVEWLAEYHLLHGIDLRPILTSIPTSARYAICCGSPQDWIRWCWASRRFSARSRPPIRPLTALAPSAHCWSACSSTPSPWPSRYAPMPASAPVRCRWPSQRWAWPKQIFADLPRRTALLIGAGDTIELVARHLHENALGRLIVANRTLERAPELVAPFNGYAIALDDIPAHLGEADMVITATASPGLLLEAPLVRRCLKQRRHGPMFVVDLAVPRDIDPTVARTGRCVSVHRR